MQELIALPVPGALSLSDSINTATLYLFSCNFSHLGLLHSDLVFGIAFPVDLYSGPNFFPLISSFLRIKYEIRGFFLYMDPVIQIFKNKDIKCKFYVKELFP